MVTNTPPVHSADDDSGDATPGDDATDTPVFEAVATAHPELQDAAPELIEPGPAVIEPESAEPALSAADPVVIEPAVAESAPVQPIAAEPVVAEPVRSDPADAEPVVAAPMTVAPVAAPMQTVYVTAPTPPKKRGNRGFGALFALIALVVFAGLFAGIIAVVMLLILPAASFTSSFTAFLASSAFWVPLVAFLVFFLLMVLIVNRAGWAVWVLGSFLVAVLVYFASIGGNLLAANIFQMTQEQAAEGFRQLALSAPIVVATVLAREVTIWFGAAIASRGRKVKASNLESQATFDRELADSRAGIL